MTALNPLDLDYTDGKSYQTTLTVSRIGDGNFEYKFEASDGTNQAIGPPTLEQNLAVGATNNKYVPSEYLTIQAAIDAADPGDHVVVDSGSYPEYITFRGKSISVESANGAALTSIIGTSSDDTPAVTFATAETTSSILDGFTINNQREGGTKSRGIYVSSASPTIKNCVVEGNSIVNADGGGLYATGGAPVTADTTIGTSTYPNSARYGAGVYVTSGASPEMTGGGVMYNTSVNSGAGIYSNGCALVLTDCSVDSNQVSLIGSYDAGGIYLNGASACATITGGSVDSNRGRYGGGIYVNGSTAARPLSISGASISSNTSGNQGGGIRLASITNTVTISNSSISLNTAPSGGGGIHNVGAPLEITDSQVNTNTLTGGGQRGGGLYMSVAKTLVATGTTFNGNQATNYGGGAYITGGATASFTGGSINSNTSTTGDGGGIAVDSTCILDLARVNVRGNQARYGGGIYFSSTSATGATLTNCSITGNTHCSGTLDGGGIYTSGTKMAILNCTVAGNYSRRYGGGIRVQAGTVTIVNSIVYGNTAASTGPQISGSPTVSYSDVQGGFGGTGNINADPVWVSFGAGDQASSSNPKTSGDYHIQSGSPCRNRTDIPTGPSEDIDGDGRPQETYYDMGSDEYR